MSTSIESRGFTRKGFVSNLVINDIAVLCFLLAFSAGSIFLFQNGVWTPGDSRTLFALFFGIFFPLTIINQFTKTFVLADTKVIIICGLNYKWFQNEIKIVEVDYLEVSNYWWKRANVVLVCKNGTKHRLSIKEIEDFVYLLTTINPNVKIAER